MANPVSSNPTSVDDLYPRQWVAAADLNGKAVAVKIVRVDVETFHVPAINEKKTAAVLSFEGARRRLILNKTQCRALAEITRSGQFKDWIGKTVALQAAKAPNGKPTIAILPARSAPAEPPRHWSADLAQRATFDAAVSGLGFSGQQVAEALGVDRAEAFAGTLQEALDALDAYASDLARAADEAEEA